MALPLWVSLPVTRGHSEGPDGMLSSAPRKRPACGHLGWALPGTQVRPGTAGGELTARAPS